MPHKFTKADRAKAVANRKHNYEQHRLKAQQAIVATGTTELSMDKVTTVTSGEALAHSNFISGKETKTVHTVEVFDWWEVPLLTAVERLNNIKREYDRAAQIVLQRQSQLPPGPLHCWVWDNRERPDMPKAAVAQCKRLIADRAKAAFTNDGYKDHPGDATEKIRSIYACSMLCFQAYQQLRPVGGLSRH